MIFFETSLAGVYLVEPERLNDHRGFFSRTWCEGEFRGQGLNPELAQCSLSFNRRRGTLRGLHYQVSPHQEAKLVRCTMGAIYDIAVDLRPGSDSYLKWTGVELNADNRKMLYIPEGVAHGFQTLVDNSEVFYQMSTSYKPHSSRGVRWNDPAFQVEWPAEINEISEKDRNYADYKAEMI